MEPNGRTFLDKVLDIVKEEASIETSLIQFEHPKELKEILREDLDISRPVSDHVLEQTIRNVLRYSVKTNNPSFRNQLYGGTDPYGLAGSWIAEAFNTSQYTFEVAPVFTLIEMKVLEHILKLFGNPHGDGIFSPGGSISMLYALAAARFKAFPEIKEKGMRGLPEMIIITSEESHYSVLKAAHWLGIGTNNVRIIKTNDHGQMLPAELDRCLSEELAHGVHPIMVNATAGTTVLGAIDDLDTIAEICQRYNTWLHVDACWGGTLMLSTKLRDKLKGINRANSISWNPHKMMGVPLQCSVVLFRDKGLLHEANAASAQYLFQQDKFYDVSHDTGDKSIQCGRKIDAFKLWVIWKARGDAGLCQLTDHVMHIAEFCIQTVARKDGFRLVSEHLQCPNVCFWYIPTFMRNQEENQSWWGTIHKITPKIKEKMTLTSRAMVAYSPLGNRKNFFRLTFTFHPILEEKNVLDILQSIEECGEMITLSTF